VAGFGALRGACRCSRAGKSGFAKNNLPNATIAALPESTVDSAWVREKSL
jgi:hypothetical protein